jgi:hypothetical protein
MKISDLLQQSSVSGIAKSCLVPYLVNVFCGLIISVFDQKLVQQLCYEQVHCYVARFKYQTKVQVFADEQPLLAMPVFPSNSADQLFELI